MLRMNAVTGITVADLSRTPAIRDGRSLSESKSFRGKPLSLQIQRDVHFPQIVQNHADKMSAKISEICGILFAGHSRPDNLSNCRKIAGSGEFAHAIYEIHSIQSQVTVIQNGLQVDQSDCEAVRNEITPVQSEVRVNQNEVTVIQRTLQVVQSKVQLIQSESNVMQSDLNVIRSRSQCQHCQSHFKHCHEKVVRNEMQAVQPCQGLEP